MKSESTDGLIEKLEEAIKKAPSSAMVKPPLVGIYNLTGLAFDSLRLWTMMLGERNLKDLKNSLRPGSTLKPGRTLKKLLEAWEKEQYGIYIDSQNDISLYPINPDTTHEYTGMDEGVLVHKGFIINGGNNIENLRRYGVFGDPDITFPTYLMRPGSNPVVYGRKDSRVALFVDKKKLMDKRSIFIDPESIAEDPYLNDKLGDSYFVLGGIPGEAIVGFRKESKEYEIRPYPKPVLLGV